jgi:hypothetical protein
MSEPTPAEMTTGEEVLAQIREYRSAARRIVEADHVSVKRRCLGLLELVDAARSESDPIVRAWSERSIWEEAREFLGVDDGQPVPPLGYEAAQRAMRAQGYSSCPHCHSVLATDVDLARWARIRVADAERRDARTKAIDQ